jgi:type IV fimbrial biogenesis protein FimT
MSVQRLGIARGFTIVELMVTLAVLAVLLAAAGPSFADFFERYRLRSAVDDTLSLFAQARQGAVESDRNVRVDVDTTAGSWCLGAIEVTQTAAQIAQGALVTAAPAGCGCRTAPANCVVDGSVLVVDGGGRPGVALTVANGSFTYDSKGGTLSNLAIQPRIDFASSSQRYGLSVMVNALGQARACTMAGKRPVPGYRPCP